MTEPCDRSVAALSEIAAARANGTVVAVTHSGFLMGFFEHVLGLAPGNGWWFRRHNASFSAFEFAGGRWSLENWNDIRHLLDGSAVSPMVRSTNSGQPVSRQRHLR